MVSQPTLTPQPRGHPGSGVLRGTPIPFSGSISLPLKGNINQKKKKKSATNSRYAEEHRELDLQMPIEELIDLLSDVAEQDPEAIVLVQCEATSSVKHPIKGIRPKLSSNSNVIEVVIIEYNNRDDRWLP